jgi:hypothetical protein
VVFTQDGKKCRIKSAMQSTTKVPYESVVTKNTPTSQEDPGSSENNENKLPTKEEIEARIKKEEEEF